MKFLIRFDWQATQAGFQGGLNNDNPFGQRTEFEPLEAKDWDEAKRVVGLRNEVRFKLNKPVHRFDGEYLTGIVVMEDKPAPFRMHSWNRI
jgi:hypothetical protein